MSKCVVFVMTPFISHLMPTYKLAKHFQDRGYLVVYVSSLKLKKEIEAHGFTFQDSAIRDENGSFLKMEQLVPYVISRFNPEVCLIELAFWNWALFLLGLGQRFMMIQTWPCCNKAPYLLPEGYRIVHKRNLFTFLKNEWEWRAHNRKNEKEFHSEEVSGYYQDLIKKAKLDPAVRYITKKDRIGYFKVLNVTELILYPIEFDFPRKRDPLTRFIGPFIDKSRIEQPFNWSVIKDTSRPVIFCSMGSLTSLFKKRNTFYERMIAAFTDRPDLTLIMAVGSSSQDFQNRELPANIHLCEYAPQLEILKRAAVFITHGGAGSIKESIQFGVPVIVYPFQARSDMYGNADRIVYHNLGMLGDIEKDSAPDIINRVDQVRNNKSIKRSISTMKATFEAYEKNEHKIIDTLLQN